MNSNKSLTTAVPYQLQHVSAKKQRDSPTSSILKTPTAIFVSNRSSFIRTRRLKFANGPESGKAVKEERETSCDSASTNSTPDFSDADKYNFEQDRFQANLVEVALSPENKMKISSDSWKAFLEYRKYEDYSSETEKTDYTYSRLSKFRNKEIIPGFRVRPNLSRCPISRRDYYSIYEDHSYSTRFLPGASYSLDTATYDNSSSFHRGKLDFDNNSFENSGYCQNEMYEYDEFENNETLNYDDKYYSTFGDSTKYLREKKEFVHNAFDIDDQSKNFGTSWGVDETDDDDFNFLTHNEGKTTYHGPKKIGGFLYAIYATIIYGITSIPTLFKDLFSKYILRRKTYPYNYSAVSWNPSSQSRTYSYEKYQSNERKRFSTWWYQSFIYALYKKLITTSSNSVKYLRTKYYQASRKGKFFSFFIPLLFLLVLWLSKAEDENAYVSNQITALKCRTGYYLSPARNHVNSLWRTISAYGEKIFGQSLQPLGHLIKSSCSILLSLSQWLFNFIFSMIIGLFSMFNLLKNLFSYIWMLLVNIFTDTIERKNNISNAIYDFFSNIIFTVLNGIAFIIDYTCNFVAMAFEYFKSLAIIYPLYQSKETDIQNVKLSTHEQDYSGLTLHWNELRKRIENLEIELKKVKDENSNDNLMLQKDMELNNKALQKYQAIIKENLRRFNSKPLHLSKSSIQYYLDSLSEDLKNWILARFILKSDSKDMEEDNFALLMAKYGNRSDQELKMLQDRFTRFINEYNKELTSLKRDMSIAHYHEINGNDVSLSVIKRIVADEIKLHDADKTGKVDFALESAGGQVLSVKCTETYDYCLKSSDLFGLSLCLHPRKNAPQEAINPGMAPGQCWAFAGSQGYLILKLSHTIIVTGFTMEHISRLLAPNGRIESAPRKFDVWGLKRLDDPEPHLFGEYEYRDNNDTYQYFPVMSHSQDPYKIIELHIASNHGNREYTCLYRIRVHGNIYPSQL